MVIYPCAYFDAYLHLECRLKMFDHFPLIKKKKEERSRLNNFDGGECFLDSCGRFIMD